VQNKREKVFSEKVSCPYPLSWCKHYARYSSNRQW